MLGSPGSGKTMLARRLPTILPPLTPDESLETTRIYSAIGRAAARRIAAQHAAVPQPAPHDLATPAWSAAAPIPQPGEISLAHHGVLFLDELPEFNRRSLEALRQPLEEGRVTISRRGALDHVPGRLRAGRRDEPVPVRLPRRPEARRASVPRSRSRSTWAASAARCWTASTCTSKCRRCRSRTLSKPADGTGSAAMREQVYQARAIQAKRFGSGAGQAERPDDLAADPQRTASSTRRATPTLKEAMEALGPVGPRPRPHPARGPHGRRPRRQRVDHRKTTSPRRSATGRWTASCGSGSHD